MRLFSLAMAVVWALLLQGCGAFVRIAPTTTTLPDGGMLLPTRACADSFLVEATINGRGPYAMLIDTGASASVVTPRVAGELEDDLKPTMLAASGATGKLVPIRQRLEVESLTVGEFTVGGFDALVMELGAFETAVGGRLDGILGYPAFRDCLLQIDYPRQQVLLARDTLAQDPPRTLKLLDDDAPRLELILQGRAFKPVLDTGSGGHLKLSPRGWRRGGNSGLEYEHAPRPVGAAVAIGGHSIRRAGRLDGEIELAGTTLLDPIAEESPGMMLVGTRVMRHFAVTFDQRAKLVRFDPLPEFERGAPITFDSVYGIGIGAIPVGGLKGGAFRITEVFEGGPGAAAGLRKDDLVRTIDGRAVMDLICERRALFTEERTTVLGVERDGMAFEAVVRVERVVP